MRRLMTIATLSLIAGQVQAQTDTNKGSEAFEAHCSACHNQGGIGTPGLAPPLNRPIFWQGLGKSAPDYITHVVSHGLNLKLKVNGQTYMGMFMPPVTSGSDEELADAATWVLQSLGETDYSVSAEDIKSAAAQEISKQDLAEMRKPGAEAEQ